MMGLLLTAFGLVTTAAGWWVVWRVRSVVKRISRSYNGPQVPAWALRTTPWRAVPVVGEAVMVWNRRAKLAKLMAVPLLAFGPIITTLGILLLVHEIRGYHGSEATPLAAGALLAAAVLVWRYWRRPRRGVNGAAPSGEDRTW
ncbi:hypothetical protein [Actinospica robiniae]|uniref:hypothetical protein n=1 Tax=Actinospica robiniae TaxID=304901 RepID=UPI0004274418|nr:hypothetical protein [Actinospica robiniae]